MFLIIFFGIVLLLGMGIGYAVRRREVSGKVAARDTGRAAVIFGVGAAIWIGLYRLFPGFWKDHTWESFFLLFLGVSLWAYIGTLRWRKRRAGSVLLDLGRTRTHKMFLVIGGVAAGFNMLVLGGSLWPINDELGVEDVSRYFCWISWGVFMLLLGLRHSEIRESGIFHLDRFLKWKSIESYEWEGKDGLTLTFRAKRRLPFLRRVSLGIPSVQKDNVNSLIAEHLSTATCESANGI